MTLQLFLTECAFDFVLGLIMLLTKMQIMNWCTGKPFHCWGKGFPHFRALRLLHIRILFQLCKLMRRTSEMRTVNIHKTASPNYALLEKWTHKVRIYILI